MDSISYQQILERNFPPFVARKFPDGYRLYQDNDSKHKGKSTKAWMTHKNILNNVMECPASSPDINVVEKTFLQVVITMMREIIQYNASPFLGRNHLLVKLASVKKYNTTKCIYCGSKDCAKRLGCGIHVICPACLQKEIICEICCLKI